MLGDSLAVRLQAKAALTGGDTAWLPWETGDSWSAGPRHVSVFRGVAMAASRLRLRSHESELLRELKLTCMENLLASTEERVYFKDRVSRFLFVSAGWISAYAPGRNPNELVGKTDFDVFSYEHARAAFADEREIIRTGVPLVGKLERETYSEQPDGWVSTTKMPLRDGHGQIVGTFGISRDITAQVQAESALAYRALHDPVTDLANRIALMDRLSQALLSLERRPGRLGVLFVDLDDFKTINDAFGHSAGDLVLAETGRRLAELVRRQDTVARFGGDEFVMLCSELTEQDDMRLIADRVLRAVGEPYTDGGQDLSVTCSVGIAVASDPRTDPDRLLRDADMAMFEAKKGGRNRYQLYQPGRCSRAETGRLQTQLWQAIKEGQLFLAYQPLFSLDTRQLTSVEALVRWQHPERGVVGPDEFIPFAEEHGLIGRIGAFVLDEACRQLADWLAREDWPPAFTMAVNVSGRELSDPALAGRVAEVLRRYGLPPGRLCLEITETALIGEVGDVQDTLAALSETGVRIALDDFGTGYSTLAHLQRLKVHVLKIDRSFVDQISRSSRDREIVGAVTAMSHALGMTVVGEGIESSHQLDALAALDCDEGQGLLFARPLPPDAVATLAQAQPVARSHTAAKRALAAAVTVRVHQDHLTAHDVI